MEASGCTNLWCLRSCGRCTPCKKHDYCNYCFDSPPDWNYTCTQQVGPFPLAHLNHITQACFLCLWPPGLHKNLLPSCQTGCISWRPMLCVLVSCECLSESYRGLRCCVLAAAGVPPRSLQPAIHAEGHLRCDLQSLQALPRPGRTQLLPGQRPGPVTLLGSCCLKGSSVKQAWVLRPL